MTSNAAKEYLVRSWTSEAELPAEWNARDHFEGVIRDLTPNEIVALSQNYDVMIRAAGPILDGKAYRESSTIWLDVRGKNHAKR